jgi:hypothetical protein
MRLGVAIGLFVAAGCSDRALDLPEARDLGATDASGADRSIVDQSMIQRVDLLGADLAHHDLSRADLAMPDLYVVDLSSSDLAGSCGPNDVFVGTACVKRSCEVSDQRLNCLLPDGDIGHCQGLVCVATDFLTDANNCGLPGVVCANGAACVDGLCRGGCPTSTCPDGMSCFTAYNVGCALTTCDGAHDYQACSYEIVQGINGSGQCCGTTCGYLVHLDSKNCGWCGHQCNSQCYDGICDVDCGQAIDNTLCNLGQGYCCNGTCVQYLYLGFRGCGLTGACGAGSGATCPAGSVCFTYGPYDVAGCGPTSCSGKRTGSVCANIDADGVARPGQCCGGGCANVLDDPHNCGVCGHQCPTNYSCFGGTCLPAVTCDQTGDSSPCLLGNGVEGMCCGGVCTDVEKNDRNCGGCAIACPPGTTCNGATGVVDRSQCVDNTGTPQSCTTLGCPSGYTCSYVNSAVSSCKIDSCAGLADGTTCASGGECCNGQCVSLNDLGNCGGCGLACPTGSKYCSFSECLDPGGNFVPCSSTATCPAGDTCIDLGCSDGMGRTYPCGKCFPTSCAGRSEDARCYAGGAVGGCCNGTCVSIGIDSKNCGACGRDCGGALCGGGTCEQADPTRCVPACPAGTICVETSSFYLSLGVCVGPVCGLTQDDFPYVDNTRCMAQDGQPGHCCVDGTCADLARDPLNCGFCGMPCSSGVCSGGRCQ